MLELSVNMVTEYSMALCSALLYRGIATAVTGIPEEVVEYIGCTPRDTPLIS